MRAPRRDKVGATVVSSSRRRRTGRSPSTAHTEQRSSCGPSTGCATGEQWLLGTQATRSPSYLQEEDSVALKSNPERTVRPQLGGERKLEEVGNFQGMDNVKAGVERSD